MIWIGLVIGFSVGMGTAQLVSGNVHAWLTLRRVIAELDREIQADRLAEAREMHQAALLRHVIACEMQAE